MSTFQNFIFGTFVFFWTFVRYKIDFKIFKIFKKGYDRVTVMTQS
jgi:hypothetical protein